MYHPNKDSFEILEHFPQKNSKSNLLTFKLREKKFKKIIIKKNNKKDNNDVHIDVYPSF